MTQLPFAHNKISILKKKKKKKKLIHLLRLDVYGSGYYVICTSFQVGLVIGEGGETIKNMQTRIGARIQVSFQN